MTPDKDMPLEIWMADKDGCEWLCQLKRHNIHPDEPTNIITLVSRAGLTAHKAIGEAIRAALQDKEG